MAAQSALPASSEAVWMHPPWLVPANVVLIQSNEFCKLTPGLLLIIDCPPPPHWRRMRGPGNAASRCNLPVRPRPAAAAAD